ncbi:MAG: ankyrin repeat domain-containing protein, partial [Phycisphaerales bacterium]
MTYRKATVFAAALLLCGVFSVSADELTTLQAAVRAGDLHRVETMLNESPDLIQASTEQGLTPLHLAAQTDHVDLVDHLLAAGADVGAADLSGNTP